MQIVAYLLARLSEPSSYAGLGALLALAGWNLPDAALSEIVQFLAAGCALAALCLKERGLIRAVVLVLAVAPALLGLTGCGGAIAGIGGALAIAGEASAAIDPVIAAGCAEYRNAKTAAAPLVAAGGARAASAASAVTSIESFGDAACANPPSGDPVSTAIWLGTLIGQIGTLTSSGRSG